MKYDIIVVSRESNLPFFVADECYLYPEKIN